MDNGQGQSAPDFDIDSALSSYVDSFDEQPEDEEADQADTESDETESPDAEGADEADESPDEDTDESDDEAEPELLDVEYEGKQYKVPPEIKDALLMRKDYTTKTQEVAEGRKQLEAERSQFQKSAALQQQMIGDYASLYSLDNQIDAYGNVDWMQLIQDDPVTAQQHQMRLAQLKDQRNQLAQQIQGKQFHAQQMTLAQQQELVRKGTEQLAREIPNWGAELKTALNKTGVDKYGFRADEVANVMDPRMVKVLHDAHQYQQILAKRADTQNKVAKAQPFAKPSGKKPGSRNAQTSRAKEQFMKRRDERSALALLGTLDID